MNAEQVRLQEANSGQPWRRWGPYLSERQWGTVREDYSAGGEAWDYFPHEMARSRAYRWGEDGIGGLSDDCQQLCLALALWNGQDTILKERFFGLTGNQGNHGEDVKEYYYYLDATPTHSYLRMLYKYPQGEYPYGWLVDENARRGRGQPEFELIDTGVFQENRYFDVFLEYAQVSPGNILMHVTAWNRGPDSASLWLLPQLWFRNTWSWRSPTSQQRPRLAAKGPSQVKAEHSQLGTFWLHCQPGCELLFCENDTNAPKLYALPHLPGSYYKDGIGDYLIRGHSTAIHPEQIGTKVAACYPLTVAPGGSQRIALQLLQHEQPFNWDEVSEILDRRRGEANEFYAKLQDGLEADACLVQRQALAGMIWTKQFYYYDLDRWLEGDPGQPMPPIQRQHGRNHKWRHLDNADVISMPDKWEYPWYAAWDLAFHTLPMAMIDPEFAKNQLVLMTRDWYMHPNGQLPAYEWAFDDVNPPVHAWATWRVYQMDLQATGRADREFLETVFHRLMLNFTWWVNRKDFDGNNIFQGGFLGLDNIGVFDRSTPISGGGRLDQADGTSWMAMYCLNLMRIALELARDNPVYQDIASKFFEHFLNIAKAANNLGDDTGHAGVGIWCDHDKFYYDVLHLPNGESQPLKIRSMVGLTPLFAVETIEPELLNRVPKFAARLQWLLENRPDLASLVSRWYEPGRGERRLLSLLRGHRMKRLLHRMLDPGEFLSDYGVRALSKYHQDHPYVVECDGRVMQCFGQPLSVTYEPAEGTTAMFGGNSNWRGPIWFPVNYLIIESLQKFHHYYGDDFKIEYPTHSGNLTTIQEVSQELSRRLCRIFLADQDGRRPVFGQYQKMQTDPQFKDHLLFYEYFHGDNGRGVGASHQTGWTGLVAMLLDPKHNVLNGYHD